MPTVQETLDATSQNLDDTMVYADQLIALVVAGDGVQAGLRAEIAALLAGDAATAAKADALFAKSIANEDKLRAAVPGIPPVGGVPLDLSYTPMTAFDTAAAAYTGADAVTKDGIEVHPGAAPATAYYSHSATDTVDRIPPTD